MRKRRQNRVFLSKNRFRWNFEYSSQNVWILRFGYSFFVKTIFTPQKSDFFDGLTRFLDPKFYQDRTQNLTFDARFEFENIKKRIGNGKKVFYTKNKAKLLWRNTILSLKFVKTIIIFRTSRYAFENMFFTQKNVIFQQNNVVLGPKMTLLRQIIPEMNTEVLLQTSRYSLTRF